MSVTKLGRGRSVILWDGDCGFCRRSVVKLQSLDATQSFDFSPHQEYSDEELKRVGLSRRKCERELQLVTHDGKTFGGAFALNYFFAQQKGWKILVALSLCVPVVLLIEVLAYKAVASNRMTFSKIFFPHD